VEQNKNNEYGKKFFPLDQEISNSEFNASFLINDLQNKLTSTEMNIIANKNREQTIQNIKLLNDYIGKFKLMTPSISCKIQDKLDISSISESSITQIRNYLEELASFYRLRKNETMLKKDIVVTKLVDLLGNEEAFLQFKYDYYNSSLADLVENKKEINQIIEYHNRLIRKYEPIYMIPTSGTGRAHFYAPVKIIGNRSFNTLWFNITVIWIMSIILYIMLYYDVIRKSLAFFERFRFRKKIIKL
jgi:hypothetical protein